MRQFRPGRKAVDGIEFRITPGAKTPRHVDGLEPGNDLVMAVRAPDFVNVTFEHLAIMYAFLYENEDALYPPLTGDGIRTIWDGGKRLDRMLAKSLTHGPRNAYLDEVERYRAKKAAS